NKHKNRLPSALFNGGKREIIISPHWRFSLSSKPTRTNSPPKSILNLNYSRNPNLLRPIWPMDRSADGDGPVTVVVAASGEIDQPPRSSVRRRLVQSTLFPHKSPEAVKSAGEKKKRDDEEGNGDSKDDEDEDYGSSQGKKRKVARKRKASNSQPRTPKKSKGRSSANSTPKKNQTINGIDLTEDKIVTPPSMPNVRLQAKMADQEYSQKFAGKQLHPFFSMRKGSKKQQGITDVLRGCDQSSTPPIHVFETADVCNIYTSVCQRRS
ncbi:hypothetical protein LINGRAHAP2_LOCUS9513, partial [Linum grandiflorum]